MEGSFSTQVHSVAYEAVQSPITGATVTVECGTVQSAAVLGATVTLQSPVSGAIVPEAQLTVQLPVAEATVI